MKIIGQEKTIKELDKIYKIFKMSNCEIRPHFILTGQSGSGKSMTIKYLCETHNLEYLEINAAALTKEGTSGNSLSKALSPLLHIGNKPTVVFVDEFDKLFISGNSNNSLAHETTVGVQNEFLKVLESDTASVFGDYGKYIKANTKNCLFVFAGAFNGQESISIDDLRSFGMKTEFLGRVGLVFNTAKLSLENLFTILEDNTLLDNYLELFKDVNKEDVIKAIKEILEQSYDFNTIGARLINTLIHQYFITGGKMKEAVKQTTFTVKLGLN